MTQQFFALPEPVKARYPLHRNAGWESKAQVRPSTSSDWEDSGGEVGAFQVLLCY